MAKSSPLVRRPELLVTADRLRAHIEHLAGTIGERHVLRFGALDAARGIYGEQSQAHDQS